MFEGWLPGYPSTGGSLSAKERRGGLLQAKSLLNDGKEFLAVGQGNQGEINRQQYALAAYLLVVPANNAGQATFRYTRADAGYDEWWYYENYDYQLGAPLGDYYEPVANMLQRDFENGHVTLNLDSLKSNIILNTP